MTKSVFTPRYKYMRELLREARENAGEKQKKLSEKLGMPTSYIGKCELGERRIDVIEFIEIVKILKLDPVEIFKKIAEYEE